MSARGARPEYRMAARGLLSGNAEPYSVPGLLGQLRQETFVGGLIGDAWDGMMMPGRVYSGEVPAYAQDPTTGEFVTNPAMLTGANQLAGLAMTGGLAGPSDPLAIASGVRRTALSHELPMDQASRSARAVAMGFHTKMPLYHGTAADFSSFDLAKGGATTAAEPARLGVWTALDPQVADEFAEKAAKKSHGSPSVLPLVHKAKKPAVLSLDGTETNEEIAATVSGAWSAGYDAILMKNYTSPGGKNASILVVKDPPNSGLRTQCLILRRPARQTC